MKLRYIVPMAAAGGFLFVHFRRGGTLSLESMRDTARDLFGTAKESAIEAKEVVERDIVHDVAETLADATDGEPDVPRA